MLDDSNNPANVASTHNVQLRSLLIPRASRRKFFIQFTLITVLAWVVGGIASIALEKTIVEIRQLSLYPWVKYLSSILFAVIFGANQAIVLNKYISGWLWMLATSGGWLIFSIVSAAWNNYISTIAESLNKTLSFEQMLIFSILSTIAHILSGIWLGFLQWLVLRRYVVNAWWWNFIPSISLFIISIFILLLSFVQEFIPEVSRAQILYLSGQGFTAVILGAIPGIGLCRLKINSRRTNDISSASPAK